MSVEDKNESSSSKVGVVHSVIRSYRANKRQGTHATKTRSMVSGGGKKPFKQKGTGGARQGSSRSPLREGGGVAHGPQPRNYRLKSNKKTKKMAFALSFEDKRSSNKVVEANAFSSKSYSTKFALEYLVSSGVSVLDNILVVLEAQDHIQYRSMRNLANVTVKISSEINAEDILRSKLLFGTKEALAKLDSRASGVRVS